VRPLLAHGVAATPVAAPAAADSWFVGYSWSVLHCAPPAPAAPSAPPACHRATHLGWRFSSPSGDAFDALIVTYDEQPAGISVSAVPVVAAASLRVGRPSPPLSFMSPIHHA
jgi:hypothetical protein